MPDSRFATIDLWTLDNARHVARGLGVPEGPIGWGVLEMWRMCRALSRDIVRPDYVEGCFRGQAPPRLLDFLEAFRLIEKMDDGQIRVLHVPFDTARSVDDPGFVYFVQAGTGPIKIGFAADVAKRIRSLQTAHPSELVLLAQTPGVLADERAMHARFRHLRLNGEWFRAEEDLLAFIRGLAKKGG